MAAGLGERPQGGRPAGQQGDAAVITIAEATQQAVRLALFRRPLAAIQDRRHPYQDVPQEAAEVAGRPT
jgi:hypothetical protein